MPQCVAPLKDGSRRCMKDGIRDKEYKYCYYHGPKYGVYVEGGESPSGAPIQATNTDTDTAATDTTHRAAFVPASGVASTSSHRILDRPYRGKHHTTLDMDHQCLSLIADGSRRCLKSGIAENDYLYCEWHKALTIKRCSGFTRSGVPCRAEVRPPRTGEYCKDDHDPALERSTDPSIFRIDGLREERQAMVCAYRGNSDQYTGELLVNSMRQRQLDHVVEIQCARDCYDIVCGGRVVSGGRRENQELLKKVKASINDTTNLNFTSKDINTLKFEAVYAYLNDYSRDDVSDQGLMYYLSSVRNKYDPITRLNRKVSKAIATEMVRSYDGVVDTFEQENVSHSEFCDRFHDLIISGMKLK